jgi:hypothetical protein
MSRSDYSVDSVVITNVTGNEFEIKDLVTGIDMYESLSSPYIKCELTIADAANMIETIPIIGQEKIKVIIKDLNIGNAIKRDFYVSSIQNYVKGNNQSSVYILKLVTEEFMMNSLSLVSQAFTGQINQSIDKILNNYLNSKTKVSESTNGDYRLIVPNWNPYKAIDWLTRRAITTTGYPFCFYETLKDGIYFESYESMFNKNVFEKYVHRSNSLNKDDADQTGAIMKTALRYDITEMSNTGKNILRGAFGQSMHIIDHANKSYNLIKYDYQKDFKRKKRLDKNAFLSESFKVNNKSISEYDVLHSVALKNSLAYESTNLNNYNNQIEFTKLESDPLIYQLGLIKINMTVRGRTDLSVGKVIEFEVEKNKPISSSNTKNSNEYLSGKYLIQNIHHKMENGLYYIIMDIIKESLGKKAK